MHTLRNTILDIALSQGSNARQRQGRRTKRLARLWLGEVSGPAVWHSRCSDGRRTKNQQGTKKMTAGIFTVLPTHPMRQPWPILAEGSTSTLPAKPGPLPSSGDCLMDSESRYRCRPAGEEEPEPTTVNLDHAWTWCTRMVQPHSNLVKPLLILSVLIRGLD